MNVQKAYLEACKLTDRKYIKTILDFKEAYGFIFGTSKTEVDIGAECILISKNDLTDAAIIPIIYETLDFLDTGTKLPLTIIK